MSSESQTQRPSWLERVRLAKLEDASAKLTKIVDDSLATAAFEAKAIEANTELSDFAREVELEVAGESVRCNVKHEVESAMAASRSSLEETLAEQDCGERTSRDVLAAFDADSKKGQAAALSDFESGIADEPSEPKKLLGFAERLKAAREAAKENVPPKETPPASNNTWSVSAPRRDVRLREETVAAAAPKGRTKMFVIAGGAAAVALAVGVFVVVGAGGEPTPKPARADVLERDRPLGYGSAKRLEQWQRQRKERKPKAVDELRRVKEGAAGKKRVRKAPSVAKRAKVRRRPAVELDEPQGAGEQLSTSLGEETGEGSTASSAVTEPAATDDEASSEPTGAERGEPKQ